MGLGYHDCLADMSDTPTLIPREVLFGNPERTSPRLSPDGGRMAYLAPDEGVLNCWVRTVGLEDDRAVTKDRGRGIRTFFWAHDKRHLLYLQDADGDENWRLYSVNLETDEIRDLTPFENVRVNEVFTDPNFPDDILLSLNRRNPEVFDLHRLHLSSAEVEPEAENPGHYVGWLTDNDFRVRGATAALPEGGFQLLVSPAPGAEFEPCLTWGPEDNGGCLGFTPDGEHLYIEDSLESDTTELYTVDLKAQGRNVLSRDERVDLGPVLVHPTRHHVQAVGTQSRSVFAGKYSMRRSPRTLPPLRRFTLGSSISSAVTWRTKRGSTAYTSDQEAVAYYAYDRETRQATFLFRNRSDLGNYTLAPMRPVEIPARDGLMLHSYLTVPAGEARNLPLVLNVHGGPWARDSWGYDPEAQWLANRGYAVLQVNYRGSTGFGKKFMNAGNREWGAKMHDDLLDAVDWAVSERRCRSRACLHLWGQLRRLRGAGRRGLYSRCFLLRGRYRRAVEHLHA